MQRKLAGYVLLSFLSFGVFTTLFHTVANAQTTTSRITAVTPSITHPTPVPSPTLKLLAKAAQPTPVEKEPVPYKLQTFEGPTPTAAPSQNTPTPTSAPQEKSIAVITPTAVPTDPPTPTATPLPKPVVSAGEYDPLFEKYASEYGIDKEDLKRIAKCESGFNPNADAGQYTGMFQFMAQTWSSTRSQMGLDPNPDLRKNAEESIKTASFKIKNGGRSAWPNC